jgi:hypothetical protein
MRENVRVDSRAVADADIGTLWSYRQSASVTPKAADNIGKSASEELEIADPIIG